MCNPLMVGLIWNLEFQNQISSRSHFLFLSNHRNMENFEIVQHSLHAMIGGWCSVDCCPSCSSPDFTRKNLFNHPHYVLPCVPETPLLYGWGESPWNAQHHEGQWYINQNHCQPHFFQPVCFNDGHHWHFAKPTISKNTSYIAKVSFCMFGQQKESVLFPFLLNIFFFGRKKTTLLNCCLALTGLGSMWYVWITITVFFFLLSPFWR